jgi:hypothetical protein
MSGGNISFKCPKDVEKDIENLKKRIQEDSKNYK